jgi:tripartite-type tricarboxylate transporter receptor subunit TctC
MRKLLSAVCAALALIAGTAAHAQQSYPVRPVRIIIPFPPGNTTDIIARLIGPKMTEKLGQPVIVENMPGASGQIGLAALARAQPDGYTLGAGQGGNLVVAPHTNKNLPYDPLKDFTPIVLSAFNYLAIFASNEAPFKTLAEMVAWAKANPGKLTVATNGEGGFPHLAFEDLRLRGGFTYTHVPYKGSSQIGTDLMGNQVQVAIDGITGLTPQVRAGKLRLLAVTNKNRVDLWKDVPAASEVVAGFESGGWFGFVAPAGTPAHIVNTLNAVMNEAMKQPEVAEKLAAAGLIISTEPPQFFADVIRRDYDRYGKLARDIGFEPR